MNSFGKSLFWIGFILLMGVIVAYLIMMTVGSMAIGTWVTTLTICGVIFVAGIFMLLGRLSERHAEANKIEGRHTSELNADYTRNV